MADMDQKVPPPGRSAARWFLFLTFYHLIPVPWYLAVIAGLAPASFLCAAGIASLFSGDNDGLAFAGFFLASALISGLIFYVAAWLLASGISRLRRPLARTGTLLLLLAACLIAATNPIFVSGGHGSTSNYSLFDFIRILGDFGISEFRVIAYFASLSALLLGLLIYQQTAARRAQLSAEKWLRRRRIRRRLLAASLLALLLVFGWSNRMMLVVKPLADLGIASAQYRLAMAIKTESGRNYQGYLVRAAEQGHIRAALELVRHPRSQQEKLRWLPVAAEGGMADAQYQLYLELQKPASTVLSSRTASDWLEKAATGEQRDAQFDLGNYYQKGHAPLGYPKDVAKARQWWERAASNGHIRASDELSWRYEKGVQGFPRDPERAIELLNLAADDYEHGRNGHSQNPQRASAKRARAEVIATREELVKRGDVQAQVKLAHELLQQSEASVEVRAEGLALLELAASQGDAQLQYELGSIFLFGRNGQAIDLTRGRGWWAKALEQNQVQTMEDVAPAYQSGRFGYPTDLLKAKEMARKLVDAYREGLFGVDPDSAKEARWKNELKHIDRLIESAGGSYQSPEGLQKKAEAGDPLAQYQLGRQMLVSGPATQRLQGLAWIERAAEGGYAEAQYRLVTYFESQAGIMRQDPARGVAFLKRAADQNHLPAMGVMALAYEKGRSGLTRNLEKAQEWYQRLLQAYETGGYQGEIDDRFIPFNRQRLIYVSKALKNETARALRYSEATPLEQQVIEMEDRYRIEFQNAVNALDRRDGSPAGQVKTRAAFEQLREKYNRLRDTEIARLKEIDQNRAHQ